MVLWREFGIMNCFTCEASFHGFIDLERVTKEFGIGDYEGMGVVLAETMLEYEILLQEDERLKREKQIEKRKKKKIPTISRRFSNSQGDSNDDKTSDNPNEP